MNRNYPCPQKKTRRHELTKTSTQIGTGSSYIMQQAKQLARNSTEQVRVFTAYGRNKNTATKSALQAELEESKAVTNG